MLLKINDAKQWTIKKFGVNESQMVVGYNEINREDLLAVIPHYLYNRIIIDEIKVDLIRIRNTLVFTEISSQKILRKIIIYTR